MFLIKFEFQRDKKDKKYDKFLQMIMHFFMNSSLPQLKTSNSKNNSPKLIEGSF